MAKNQESNLGLMIHQRMMAMGVAPMPRNYELFYEFYVGTDARLKAEIEALGPHPKQTHLDWLMQRYLPNHTAETFAGGIIKSLAFYLDNVQDAIEGEKSGLNSFTEALGLASKRVSASSETMSPEVLKNVAELVVKVAQTKLQQSERVAGEISGSSDKLKGLKDELAEYKRLAHTDPMTKLANRRAFDETLSKFYSEGNGQRSALLVLDVDKFKNFNDKHGHPAGDRVLSIVGAVLKNNVRDAFIARTGGEEFAVVLDNVSPEDTARIAERIRAAVQATRLVSADDKKQDFGNVTVSIGMCMGNQAANGQELYRKADEALYDAKNSGRNKLAFAKTAPAAMPVVRIEAPQQKPDRYAMYKEADGLYDRRMTP